MRNFTFLPWFAILILIGCKSKTPEVDLKIIPVKSGDYWGYIDQEGKIKINPQFNRAYAFNEDLALVRTSDNKFGFINSEGKFIINSSYKSALSFSEGLALVVRENTQLTYIDKEGKTKLTLPSEIEKASSFTEGLALAFSNGLFGYIDKEGKTAIPFKFNKASKFSEGLARVANYDSTTHEYKWGFINLKGELVINCQFADVSDFANGLALIYNGKQYGYIDKEGKFVVNPQFDYASTFEGDYAIIRQGDLYGYIDKEGKITINPQFKGADFFFNNDLAAVLSTDGKYGFIDKEGKFSINPQFDYVTRYYGDISVIKMAKKYGLIDKKGKIIVNPQFDDFNVQKDNDNWVYSDYFDLAGTVSYLLNGVSKSSFLEFSGTTSFQNLKVKYPNLNQDNYSQFSQFTPLTSNKFIKLWQLRFSFKGGLLNYSDSYTDQQVYDPVAGGYVNQKTYAGTQTTVNENATLNDVVLSFSLYDKANSKKTEIINDFTERLKKDYGFQSVNVEGYYQGVTKLQNETYSIMIEAADFTDGSNLKISVSF